MPHCIECHAEYDARRKALGYKTCLDCGEVTARAVKHCTVPGHKQGYFVVGNREELKVLNPKRVGW